LGEEVNPEITRRTILKGICAAFAISVIPANLSIFKKEVANKFNPSLVYGQGIEVPTLDLNNPSTKLCLRKLIVNLKKILPRGTPFEIRAAIPGNYGRYNAIAWYYCPGMENKQFRNKQWKYDPIEGVYVLGRFLA